MRKIFLLLFVLSSAFARAQTAASYQFAALGGTYTSITGTSVGGILQDDNTVTSIPIGFNFVFCGNTYNTGSVCSNGWFSFANSSSNSLGNAQSSLTLFTPGIMPLWDDLSGASSTAVYATTGPTGSRVFTMQWANWEWHYGTTNVISFQMKLFEGTNVIQCIYTPGVNSPVSASATIGIANNGTDYQTLNNTSTAPVSSSTVFTTSIASNPAAGQIYQWTPPVPCSGAPNAGNAFALPNPVCPSRAFTLTDTGSTVASGIVYQWQSSTSATGPWTNITGATSTAYAVSAGITAATFYRLRDSCSISNQVSYSNVVLVTLALAADCYCIPTYTNGGSADYIASVTLGTLSNNSSAYGNPSPFYVDYTPQQPSPLAIPNLPVSSTNTVTITFGADGSQFNGVWIDFNHDGVFSTTEFFTTGTNAGGNGTANVSFTVPAAAALGITRMRIRGGDDSQPNSGQACNASNSTFGEAEDYLVRIVPQVPPAPTVTNNSPLCPGSTLTITANTLPLVYPNTTYTLTGPGIALPISSTTGIFTIPNITTAYNGTASVTATSGGFTSPAGTTTIIVYPTPTITLGTVAPPTTCASSTATIQINSLANSTTYTLRYRKNGVQITPVSITSTATGSYTISGLTQGTYDSIRLTTANGCITNILGPVVISDPNPPSNPTLSQNTPLCSGTTLTLTAGSSGAAYGAGAVYTFTGVGGFAPAAGTSNTATRPSFVVANNGVYSVFVTVNNCQSATTSLTVAMTPASAAPVPANVTYCQFEVASPVTATGTNLLWYAAATGGTGSAVAPVPNTSVAGSQTFYVSQSAPCESPRAAVVVTIKPKPGTPGVSALPLQLCQYEVASALTATGTGLLWYATATGGTGTAAAPVPVTTVPGTYNFYVSQTVNGCESDRSAITVFVKPKPAPPVVVSPANLCQNDNSGPLTAQGQSLRWYTTATGGTGVTAAPVPNTGYEDSFVYYVTQTVNGCESDRAQLKVVVNYLPNGIIIGSTPWVCEEGIDTLTYYGNGRPDAIYNWKAPTPQTTVLSGLGTRGPLVVQFNTPGTQTIRLQVNNKGCLSPLLTAAIVVRPLPHPYFVHSKDDICTDQVVNIALNHITPDIQTYNWQGFDGATIAYGTYNGGPFGLSWSQPGIHIISLTATANACTSHPTYDTINVHAYPDATIDYGGVSLDRCSGDSLLLSVKQGLDSTTYAWTPAAYFYNRSDSTAVVFATPKFTGYIGVRVTSVYGCASQDSILVTTRPCCGVTFPNAFSPNNDTRNDFFRPVTAGHHEVLTFRVINRWGQVIYESKDERKGWDGTYNGVAQDMGTYYYYFHYRCADGQDLEDKGEVLLMR